MRNPFAMMGLGLLLMIVGIVLPLLMVIRVVEPGFFLSFVSFTASVSGLFLGMIGATSYVQLHRDRRPHDNPYKGRDEDSRRDD